MGLAHAYGSESSEATLRQMQLLLLDLQFSFLRVVESHVKMSEDSQTGNKGKITAAEREERLEARQ